MPRCKNCKGKGYFNVKTNNKLTGECYYCRGTGEQERKYKRNEAQE